MRAPLVRVTAMKLSPLASLSLSLSEGREKTVVGAKQQYLTWRHSYRSTLGMELRVDEAGLPRERGKHKRKKSDLRNLRKQPVPNRNFSDRAYGVLVWPTRRVPHTPSHTTTTLRTSALSSNRTPCSTCIKLLGVPVRSLRPQELGNRGEQRGRWVHRGSAPVLTLL